MNNGFPLVPLGGVLNRRRDEIVVQELEEYSRLTIRMNGGGIVLRDRVPGSEIGTKRQFVARSGQLLLSKIDARNGAFGVVPEECDEAIITGNFWAFDTDDERLDVRYLNYLTKTRLFVDSCIRASEGTTNRRYLQEPKFLAQSTPLPPLPEQRRIVARIEELAARIEEARGLRRQAVEEAEALLGSATIPIFDNNREEMVSIEEMVGRSNLKNGKSLKTTDELSEVSCLILSSLRQGTVDCDNVKPVPMTAAEAEPFLVRSGDVFVVQGNGSKQLVGQAGLVQDQPEHVIFPDLFIKVPLDNDTIVPRFFVAMWNSKPMRDHIEMTAKTTSGIWKINQSHMASFSVPLPPVSEQLRIVAYLDDLQSKIDSLKRLQSETAAELDALLPSVLDRAFKGKL